MDAHLIHELGVIPVLVTGTHRAASSYGGPSLSRTAPKDR